MHIVKMMSSLMVCCFWFILLWFGRFDDNYVDSIMIMTMMMMLMICYDDDVDVCDELAHSRGVRMSTIAMCPLCLAMK